MKFEMIFYLAREPEETLERVEDILNEMGQSLSAACATQAPKDLALVLSEAVERSQIVFISGGLLRTDQYNTINVISRALEIPLTLKPGYTNPSQRNALMLSGGVILPDPDGRMDGCALTSGTQTIFLLPDTPDAAEGIMRAGILPYLSSRYNLTAPKPAPAAVGTLVFNQPPQEPPTKSLSVVSDQYEEHTADSSHDEEPRTVHTSLALLEDSPAREEKTGAEETQPSLFARRNSDKEKKPSLFAQAMARPAIAIVFVLCVLAALGYAIFNGYNLLGTQKTARQNQETYENIRQLYGQTTDIPLPDGTLEKFGRLYQENSDIRGWITVPGTNIDYPIVQTNTSDLFYEQHDFTKAASKYGTPYFDFGNNIDKDTGNLIVYGANLGDGAMFADLANYQKPEYYLANSLIELDTLRSEMTWQIFSVCLVDSKAKGNEFHYTQTNEMDAYDFAEYVYQLRMRSLLVTDVPVASGDRLLLLVTDSDEFEGAQWVVAAVQYTGEPVSIKADNALSIQNANPLMPQKWYDLHGGNPPELEEEDYLRMLEEASETNSGKPTSPGSSTSSGAASSTGESSSSLAKNELLKVKVNGKTVTGTAADLLPQIVEAEMGPGFSKEALKAQAVATYTYLLWETDRGVTPAVELKTASAESKKAVKSVLGKRMMVKDKIPYTPYFPMSAGKTLSHKALWGEDFSHLVPVDSSWEKSLEGYQTTVTISSAKIQSRMQSAFGISLEGNPSGWLEITGHDDAAGDAGYVSSIVIGNATQSGYKFSNALGLPSHAFTIEYKSAGSSFVITTYGEGHGVGMSQRGAEGLARQGMKYQQILKHYYTGVTIQD